MMGSVSSNVVEEHGKLTKMEETFRIPQESISL
jgi:hypothetical protein